MFYTELMQVQVKNSQRVNPNRTAERQADCDLANSSLPSVESIHEQVRAEVGQGSILDYQKQLPEWLSDFSLNQKEQRRALSVFEKLDQERDKELLSDLCLACPVAGELRELIASTTLTEDEASCAHAGLLGVSYFYATLIQSDRMLARRLQQYLERGGVAVEEKQERGLLQRLDRHYAKIFKDDSLCKSLARDEFGQMNKLGETILLKGIMAPHFMLRGKMEGALKPDSKIVDLLSEKNRSSKEVFSVFTEMSQDEREVLRRLNKGRSISSTKEILIEYEPRQRDESEFAQEASWMEAVGEADSRIGAEWNFIAAGCWTISCGLWLATGHPVIAGLSLLNVGLQLWSGIRKLNHAS